MTTSFDTRFDDLPADLPVFPLQRVILLPRAELPLNIFEPRYIAMVQDALRSDRLIGMIQPRDAERLYDIGCAGRITSFSETADGRYLITLKGVCRFKIKKELCMIKGGYRRVRADWSEYKNDVIEDRDTDVCRETLIKKLHGYFSRKSISCEQWEQMKSIPCEQLIATLALVCPFEMEDKQALLEAQDLAVRAKLLQALIDIDVSGDMLKTGGTCH